LFVTVNTTVRFEFISIGAGNAVIEAASDAAVCIVTLPLVSVPVATAQPACASVPDAEVVNDIEPDAVAV
jgi:hypothetical protein